MTDLPQFKDEEGAKKVEELKKREEEDLAEILSKKYGISYSDLSRVSISTDALRLIDEKTARQANVAAFRKVGKKIDVGVLAPENQTTKQALAELGERGFIVTSYMVSRQSLERAWSFYKDLSFAMETKAGVLDISSEEIEKLRDKLTSVEAVRATVMEIIGLKKAFRLSRILEGIIAGALANGASDVHVEPQEKAVRLRYRLDGVLTDIIDFDSETNRLLTSRVKLLSGLKINVTDEAQDGRFSIKLGGEEIEIRTSMLPGPYGETTVLRILNPNTIALPFEKLGIEPKLFEILKREIKRPNGMILTTGPTGSGKTTTLYAFLRQVNAPGVKIITIEDPIEYHLKGVVQTQADKEHYTFAQGLRSALRQDPDIIMVGEIRDEDVAATAIHAALTGHLVFSTLHTNNAGGSFPRLMDLGINPKVMSSSINVVMAQRLVRTLCPSCRVERALSESERQTTERILGEIADTSLIPATRDHVFDPKGCAECHDGYKGRVGLYEAILMDEAVDAAIQENPGERDIWRAARPQGILTMPQDGVLKALGGVTSLDELARVIDLEERYW